MQQTCQRQVEDLHHIFVDWFLGKSPKAQLTADLSTRLQADFSHVAPNGRFLRGRNNLISHLDDKYGCYKGRLFTIDIYAVKLIWYDDNKCLCMYEEWQSWEQEEDSRSEGGTAGGVNQFGRLSSCLMERDDQGNFSWIHVHETWLEDETPQNTAGGASLMRRASYEEEGGAVPAVAMDNDVEPKLVVLMSKQALSKEQIASQDLAWSTLEEEGIEYTTIDGTDPPSREERNELFKTSRVWGKYPQFFLTRGSKKEFWGDHVRFAKSVEEGTLKEDLGMGEQKDGGVPVLAAAAVGAAAAGGTAAAVAASNKNHGVDTAASVGAPVAVSESEATMVLVLISEKSLSAEQATYQQTALTALQTNSVPYTTVDGSDASQREKRNELFKLSQSWGKYPQFFTMDVEGLPTFWGGREKFADSLEKGTLELDLMGSPSAPTAATSSSSPVSNLLVLMTTKGLTQSQTAYQNVATNVLVSSGIEFDAVNAASSKSADERDKLLVISGIKDYPQFFCVHEDGDTTYWGDFDRLNTAYGAGTLREELGLEEQSSSRGISTAAAVGGAAVVGAAAGGTAAAMAKDGNSSRVSFAEPADTKTPDDGLIMEPDESEHSRSASEAPMTPEEEAFMNASSGILVFEEEDHEGQSEEEESESDEEEEDMSTPAKPPEESIASPIPQDVSQKRHVSPKLDKYAKPLTWENTLVGVSVAGFDIGTSQGPIGDEVWYREMGSVLEGQAQSRVSPKPKRKLCLPEMVFPTAHVALEGHGVWLSWDVTDALEEWARAHQEIALHSSSSNRGVQVVKVKDAKLWEKRQKKLQGEKHSSRFHYDWTFSTPFVGKLEGGHWDELDASGMRLELLTDQSVPILFFDEVILYEDDLHDNGDAQFSVKLRVMPSCAFVLARFWLRVDEVVVRVRETRVLVDFFGITPRVYRDVTWRECWWDDLQANGLPTDIKSWTFQGRETPEWSMLLKSIPEVSLPNGIYKYAVMEHGEKNGGNGEPMVEL